MTSVIGPKTFDYVDRSGGSVAFEVTGSGPLIVCVPGMGDLRSSYRLVRSELAAAAAISSFIAPTLVIMGELDSDFTNPAEEALWIADQSRGDVLMVSDAGHHPQSQRPDLVGPAIAGFTKRVSSHG